MWSSFWGNGTLILISILDSHLHTPMYFFLGTSPSLDICYTTVSIPPMLVSFLSEKKTISFSGCAVQMFLGLAMGTTECVLLGMMAFDRYVAICNPLRYSVIMSKGSYVPGSWLLDHRSCQLYSTNWVCSAVALLQE